MKCVSRSMHPLRFFLVAASAFSAVFFCGCFQAGEHKLELFLMCDSYVGCDQEYAVDLMVGAEESEDESE